MIILASSSPRRLAILRSHGIEPIVVFPEVDEALPEISTADELKAALCELALTKAHDVLGRIRKGVLPDARPSHIIAADTVVYKERILGKPADTAEAIAMLEFLRNSAHQVFTGVAVIDLIAGTEQAFCDISTVVFGDYSRADIEDFIRNEQPFDKAGSYALQGEWVKHIVRVDGDRENVIGLPWYRVAGLLNTTQ